MDVRINGESIVQDGVADIPVADGVKYGSSYGLVHFVAGYCYGIETGRTKTSNYEATDGIKLVIPSTAGMNGRYNPGTNGFGAITTNTFDNAVKAAMCDGKGTAWTAEEQAAARDRIGAYRRDYRLIADITLEQESSRLIVEKDADGKDISLRKAKIFVFSPVPRENSKNNGYVQLNDKGIYYGAIDWKVNEKNSVTVVNIDILGEIAPTTVEFVPAHNVSIATTRTISMSVGNKLDYYNEINKITILANYYFDKDTRFIIVGKE